MATQTHPVYGVVVNLLGYPYRTEGIYTSFAAMTAAKPRISTPIENKFVNDPTALTMLAQIEGGYMAAYHEITGEWPCFPDNPLEGSGDWGWECWRGHWYICYYGEAAGKLPVAGAGSFEAACAIRGMRFSMHEYLYNEPHPDSLPQVEAEPAPVVEIAPGPSVESLQEENSRLKTKIEIRNQIINEGRDRYDILANENDALLDENDVLREQLGMACRDAVNNGRRASRYRAELNKAS